MNNPLISVIIPCFNVERYIGECLNSVISQTYKNIEIIVVDDGSTDSTGDVCECYSAKFGVNVYHTKNGGASAARNFGLQNAKGEFVAFIDGDDVIEQSYLETLIGGALANGSDCVVSNFVLSFPNETPNYKRLDSPCEQLLPIKAIEAMFYQEKFDTTTPCKLFKKSALKSISFPQGVIFEDLATIYQIFLQCNVVIFADCKLYNYRIFSNSVEGSAFSDKKMDSYMFVYKQLSEDQRLVEIKKAVECRLYSLTSRIFFDMPSTHPERKAIWNRMKSLRSSVILNPHARKKAKLAALISFGGIKLSSFIYRHIKKR